MKPLLSTTAMGLLLCLGYSLPASAVLARCRCDSYAHDHFGYRDQISQLARVYASLRIGHHSSFILCAHRCVRVA